MRKEQLPKVEIYTDGACSGNPGPGGWGVVLLYQGRRKELSGGEPNTTNQRMELTAALKGLASLKRPCRVTLYSDSAYLVNAFRQRWFDRWQVNGWKTTKGTPVENQDLWQELLRLTERHQVEWVKVKGHADNKENNRCDELARAAIKNGATH
ncbi:MAG: ribonuclease HI [Firmicutes bacterium]|nr:ribonuclease HI [Bacillota bacterium]